MSGTTNILQNEIATPETESPLDSMTLSEARTILERAGIKICSKCLEFKPFTEFFNQPATSDGKHSHCKDCMRTFYRLKAQNNEEHRLKLNDNARGWHREHRLESNINQAIWRSNNPEAQKAIMDRSSHIRRANLNSVPFDRSITLKDLHERDEGICQICFEVCNIEDSEIDHVIPISRGGSHTWDNVQLAHGSCNRSKGNKLPEELV